jgi:hypothetical protein
MTSKASSRFDNGHRETSLGSDLHPLICQRTFPNNDTVFVVGFLFNQQKNQQTGRILAALIEHRLAADRSNDVTSRGASAVKAMLLGPLFPRQSGFNN